MNTRVTSIVMSALTVATLASQSPPVRLDTLRVPIHTLGAIDGLMAAGRSYKIRFDGGLQFFPVLGPDYAENLPLRWRTVSVAVGDVGLVHGDPVQRQVGTMRFEYDFDGIVEAYDVLLDGVEQSFVLPTRPSVQGDLVVVGEITGKLVGDRTEGAHAPIQFRGPDGERIVEYGAATAIDANGDKYPMTSAFDGRHLELRLRAAALERAVFPLTVDPLIGADPVRNAGMTAVAAVPQPNPTDTNGISVYTRITSASDHDVFGVLTRPGFQVAGLAFADISTSYSSEKVAAGSFDFYDKILIAAERRQGFSTSLELYVHDVTNPAYRSGTSTVLNAANGEHFRNPVIGGTKGGPRVLVAYDYTEPGTGIVTIEGLRAWHDGTWLALPATIAAPSPFNHEREPAVTPYTSSNAGWVVAWAESHVGPGDIVGRNVFEPGGQNPTLGTIQPASASAIYSNVRVAGGAGRFVAMYNSSPTGIGFPGIRAQRFDWSLHGAIVRKSNRSILGGQLATSGGIAFDFATRSHWIAVYSINTGPLSSEVRAHRLGYQAATVDSTVIHQAATPFAPSIAFDGRPGNALFDIVFAELNSLDNAVMGQGYEYPSAVYDKVKYTTGCGATDDDTSDPTLSGSEFFRSRLLSHSGQPAALFFSRLPASLPLDIIGMPGCVLGVEPALVITWPATLMSSGAYEVSFPLPDAPLFASPFYTQWIWTSIGANPLGVVVNGAVAHQAL
ncbi:MAG: hypothetical protein KDB80_02665 [Planctomycetes bacterium]|nr:hypothetical protein [Planctomycetota bacterium]